MTRERGREGGREGERERQRRHYMHAPSWLPTPHITLWRSKQEHIWKSLSKSATLRQKKGGKGVSQQSSGWQCTPSHISRFSCMPNFTHFVSWHVGPLKSWPWSWWWRREWRKLPWQSRLGTPPESPPHCRTALPAAGSSATPLRPQNLDKAPVSEQRKIFFYQALDFMPLSTKLTLSWYPLNSLHHDTKDNILFVSLCVCVCMCVCVHAQFSITILQIKNACTHPDT